MKLFKNSISIILAILLLISPAFLFRSNAIAKDKSSIKNGDLVLPDIISYDEAHKNGYIGRLKGLETNLNTFVFNNGDGTCTMKNYGHPVKYIADDGEIRDITLDITSTSDGDYITAENSVITTFSKQLSKGIKLENDDVSVSMFPAISGLKIPQAKISNDNRVVSYNIGNKTTIEYSLTYAGFKEDIVVSEYTGQTQYKFIINTNGLDLMEDDGAFSLCDEAGNIKAFIGEIIIFTADEKNNAFGSMTAQTLIPNSKYELTIHIDDSYLKDPKTKYPIRIDPTIEISYSNSGAGAIEDITVNEDGPHSPTAGSVQVGIASDITLSRMLMRFPTLDLSAISSTDSITATIELRDLLCQSTPLTIECYRNDHYWSESTANPENLDYYGMRWPTQDCYITSNVVFYGNGNSDLGSHWYSFDISEEVTAWTQNTSSPEIGIYFKAESSAETAPVNNIKTFGSYNRASNRPILTIVYEPAELTDFQLDDNWLLNGTSKTFNIVNKIPSNAYASEATDFTWSSTNSAFSVNSSGTVTAPTSGGTTFLIIKHNYTGLTKMIRISSGPIREGEYRIRNEQTKMFMEVENASLLSDAKIQQNNIHNNAHCKWNLIIQSNGDYVFQSVNSGYYIMAEDDIPGVGINAVQYIEDYMETSYWRIVPTTSGAYKIVSAANYSCVMGLEGYTAGADVVLTEYYDGNVLSDEWDFFSTTFTIVNYYDSSYEGEDTLLNNISSAVEFVQKVYGDLYGIEFISKDPQQIYGLSINDCPNGTGSCSDEACGDDCSEHHKNTSNVLTQVLNLPRENNYINVLWTQYPPYFYCNEVNGNHTTTNNIGFAFLNEPAIFIADTTINDIPTFKMAAILLAHELAHFFGLSDQYDVAGHENQINCLMGDAGHDDGNIYNYDSNDPSGPFCQSCYTLLMNEIANSYFEGNS